MCSAGASLTERPQPLVQRAGQPAGPVGVGVQPARVPDGHRLEVRPVRVRITDALHDRQLPLLQELLQAGQGGMQPHAVVDPADLVLRYLQVRAVLAVVIVAVGHDGVQAVVAAVELQDDEHAAAA
jgi:hypothetical protein